LSEDEHLPRGPTREDVRRVVRRCALFAEIGVFGFGLQGNAPAAVTAGALSLLLQLAEHLSEEKPG
jgi:hypothetical protein